MANSEKVFIKVRALHSVQYTDENELILTARPGDVVSMLDSDVEGLEKLKVIERVADE